MSKAEPWRDFLGAYQVLGYSWTDEGEGRLESGGVEEAAVAMAVSGDGAEPIEMMGAVHVAGSVLMETEIRDGPAFQALDIRLQHYTPVKVG